MLCDAYYNNVAFILLFAWRQTGFTQKLLIQITGNSFSYKTRVNVNAEQLLSEYMQTHVYYNPYLYSYSDSC